MWRIYERGPLETTRGGVYSGGMWGYSGISDERDPFAGVRAKESPLRRILDLRGGGMSYDRIAKQLNTDGVIGKAGGKFYASTVHKIVGNDLHA